MTQARFDPEFQAVQAAVYDIARHEAAHTVIARSLCFVTNKVRVRANTGGGADGQSDIDLDRRLQDMDDIRTYLRERLSVLYAGVIAETMLAGQVDRDEAYKNLETHSKDDYSKIRELLKVLAGIECGPDEDFQTVLSRVEDEAWDRTSALVIRFDNIIEQLANTLRADARTFCTWSTVREWDQPEFGAGRPPPASDAP